jgi:hypothetical protein
VQGKFHKRTIFYAISIIATMLLITMVGCSSPKSNPIHSADTKTAESIEYINSDFGFRFTLPASWDKYSIIKSKWEGYNTGTQGDEIVAEGPEITIRHPLWTAEDPRQDIPIMIFSHVQWKELQKGDFHVGAAPIEPTELWSNDNFIFALPARYNYSFPKGYEEVEQIIQGHPMHAP